MKNIHPIFVFMFLVSLTLSGEDEKYTFIFGGSQRLDVGEKWIYKSTHETSFTIPGLGFIKYSGKYIYTVEFLGLEGDFWKFKSTLTDMESENYVNGIEILDQFREAMEGSSCYLYVKSSGLDDTVHHIEPVNKEDYYLLEAFEAAHMNIHPDHFKYPFGRGGVDVAIGDTWTSSYDSSKIYINMGSPSSMVSAKQSTTLKKVRERRGRKIAYIEVEELPMLELRIAVNFLGERRFITGHATGIANGEYKWDLDSGDMLKSHVNINLTGDFKMAHETFHMKVFQRFTSKKMK